MTQLDERPRTDQPPQAIDAERSVLGGMMLAPVAIADVVETLRPRDFYLPKHQAVYDCILDLYGRGEPADAITVSAELERRGELARVGGAPYLHTLIETVPTALNVGYWAVIVAEKATRRRLVEAGTRIVQSGYGAGNEDGDINEVVGRAQAAIAEVTAGESGGAGGFGPFERKVQNAAEDLRVREEARRRVRAEQRDQEPPVPLLLSDLLDEPDEPVSYRVGQLLPAGGRAMLVAQFKAGKTTLVGNLIRSAVDGEPFLDTYEVARPSGRVVLLDTELDRRMLRGWLRDHRIQNTDQVAVVSLRGKVGTFDLVDKDIRQGWVDQLRQLEAEVVILDCLRPVLDAIGLDENTDAGRFLVAFDEMLTRAGVSEAVMVHHMGHSGERGRGSSRLRDWPDVEWKLIRESQRTGEDDPNAPRYFSAFGRDVDVAESQLDYDRTARHLRLAGGSRKDTVSERKDTAIRKALFVIADELRNEEEPVSGNKIAERIVTSRKATQKNVREALKFGVQNGALRVEDGPCNGKFYSLVNREFVSSSEFVSGSSTNRE